MTSMLSLVERFPQQLEEALQIAHQYTFKTPARSFQHILLTGLGGSGIGGTIVQNYVAPSINVPFVVNKDYFIPAFVNEETLTIVCSYSGNTEETLLALEQAAQKRSTIICVTSGGKIADWAKDHQADCILVPEGMPPRACLGYSMVQILTVLQHFGYLGSEISNELQSAAKFLHQHQPAIKIEAAELAQKIIGKIPVIYTETQWEGVAVRFRQQLNENSKMLCWHHLIPEMNHNELVGWRDEATDKVVLFLRNSQEYARNGQRIKLNQEIISGCKSEIIDLKAKGEGYWQELLYMIHLTDFISVILADMRSMDSLEVKVIDFLKGSLAKSEG